MKWENNGGVSQISYLRIKQLCNVPHKPIYLNVDDNMHLAYILFNNIICIMHLERLEHVQTVRCCLGLGLSLEHSSQLSQTSPGAEWQRAGNRCCVELLAIRCGKTVSRCQRPSRQMIAKCCLSLSKTQYDIVLS